MKNPTNSKDRNFTRIIHEGVIEMAHFTPIKFSNPSGSFFLSQRIGYGHENMGINHYHSNYEIFYLLDGERIYFINDRTYHLKPNCVVFIKPFILHTVQATGPQNYARILIKFNKEFLADSITQGFEAFNLLFNKYNFVAFKPVYLKIIESIFETMKQEALNQSIDYEVNLRAQLLQLLVYAARNINDQEEIPYESPTHARIAEIVKYINQNYKEKLTLSSIAERFYMSPSYLSRTFKMVMGVLITDYLNNLRISKAQLLLKESDLSILEVAGEVGFDNQSYFGRVFKSIVGVSPLQYRKEPDAPSVPTTFRKNRNIL